MRYEKVYPQKPSGRGAAAPAASRDTTGKPLTAALDPAAGLASVHAKPPRGPHPLRPVPLMGPPLSLLLHAARVAHGLRGRLLTRAGRSLAHVEALRPTFDQDGRREPRNVSGAAHSLVSALVAPASSAPQYGCGAATFGCARAQQARQNTTPSADHARNPKAGKKPKKTADRSCGSLDKRGPHTGSARNLSKPPTLRYDGPGHSALPDAQSRTVRDAALAAVGLHARPPPPTPLPP